MIARLTAEWKTARKVVRRAIIKSKEDGWKRGSREVDGNVWGLGFCIAMGKIKKNRVRLPIEKLREVGRALFPENRFWDGFLHIAKKMIT